MGGQAEAQLNDNVFGKKNCDIGGTIVPLVSPGIISERANIIRKVLRMFSVFKLRLPMLEVVSV